MRKECRLCGYGGQGIVLAGLILAEAAGICEGKCVVQSQDYGPAARGGASKTDVVISDSEIDYPKATQLDLLVALSQRGFDEYGGDLKKDGILIVDSNNVRLARGSAGHRFPMTEIARDKIGNPVTVNMVALGTIAGAASIVKLESLKEAMLGRVPAHTHEQNLAALMAGYEIANDKTKTKKRSRSSKE